MATLDDEEAFAFPQNGTADDNASYSRTGTDEDMETLSVVSGAFTLHNGNENEDPHLATEETQTVRRLHVFLLVILFLVAVVTSAAVYVFTMKQKEQEFESSFTGQGQKVIQGFQDDSLRKLQAMDSLSSSFTSYAKVSGSEWPFVTMPDSASHFDDYLSLANAAALKILPIIGPRQRLDWEDYAKANQDWISEDLALQENRDENQSRRTLVQDLKAVESSTQRSLQTNAETIREEQHDSISSFIKNYVGVDTSRGPWIVWWQYAPVIQDRWFVNFNWLGKDGFESEAAVVTQKQKAVLSDTWTFEPGLDFQSTRDSAMTKGLLAAGGYDSYEAGEPIVFIYYPVFNEHEGDKQTVAVLSATVYWQTYFEDLLPENMNGIFAVVENSHGQTFTYQINGKKAVYLGLEDFHDRTYDRLEMSADYASFADNVHSENHRNGRYTGVPVDDEHISYRIRVYPSLEFESSYVTSQPAVYASLMLLIFVLTTLVFLLYDRIVERRQRIVLSTAVKSNAVISSLFPENVRERLMNEAQKQQEGTLTKNIGKNAESVSDKPIADFFPEVTIMFGDLVGFTAWSSTREPTQVFELLESIYGAFNKIANQRRVFKVETVGDCYVAASGLPQPRSDHAVVLARFACQCMAKIKVLTRELELSLGPGTADLTMRTGLHSGPITAGVLRGSNSRFQLFIDTMNTASRMESTSLRDRIQLSEETANLLKEAGKKHWLVEREDKIFAKGKGEMQTHWLDIVKATNRGSESLSTTTRSDISESNNSDEVSVNADIDFKTQKPAKSLSDSSSRLIKWNVEVLRRLIQQIVAHREARSAFEMDHFEHLSASSSNKPGTVIDEVKEIIELPNFNAKFFKNHESTSTIELGELVEQQLHAFLRSIASMYRDNSFHNFEHASHVMMSVNKLLSRIIAPTDIQFNPKSSVGAMASTLHDNTYDITSDPLTQFACVFSALIHDVDHTGVPNTQLINENAKIAATYKNKSIAEQNSVNISWNLLVEGNKYEALRATVYGNEAERQRFRSLVVNSVMATDIMDRGLKALQNSRWETAFAEETNSKENVNRKAAIVIEHLIQASDVAHTMQHWHVYRKWNERLFREMSHAYKQGRGAIDPADAWYKGEIGFFDFYIIPLAKKLKNCGVFGVSSEEYLKYAQNNRNEWERKGLLIVEEMVEKFKNEETPSVKSTEEGASVEFDKSVEQRLMSRLAGP